MKSILIIIGLLFLSGCSSNADLLKGELYYDRQIVNNKGNELEQQIKLKDKEFYRITYRFR